MPQLASWKLETLCSRLVTRKELTDDYLRKLKRPASATMRVLQHSAQAKGVSQSLKAQSIFSFKRIRSICVSRAPLIQCSSSEVLNHPGEATKAPSRRDLEEHRRSVGICLVNNTGLVFAARLVSPVPPAKDSVFQYRMRISQLLFVLLPVSAVPYQAFASSCYELPGVCPHRRVDDKHGTWQMPQVHPAQHMLPMRANMRCILKTSHAGIPGCT